MQGEDCKVLEAGLKHITRVTNSPNVAWYPPNESTFSFIKYVYINKKKLLSIDDAETCVCSRTDADAIVGAT
jgi:hypothetical protein